MRACTGRTGTAGGKSLLIDVGITTPIQIPKDGIHSKETQIVIIFFYHV